MNNKLEYTQVMRPKALWNEISRGRKFNTTQIDKKLISRFKSVPAMDNQEIAEAKRAGLDVVGGYVMR